MEADQDERYIAAMTTSFSDEYVSRELYDRAVETRENANAVSVRVEAENTRLRNALIDAIELADEGWTYTAYFRDKWNVDDRLSELRQVAAAGRTQGPDA